MTASQLPNLLSRSSHSLSTTEFCSWYLKKKKATQIFFKIASYLQLVYKKESIFHVVKDYCVFLRKQTRSSTQLQCDRGDKYGSWSPGTWIWEPRVPLGKRMALYNWLLHFHSPVKRTRHNVCFTEL